MLNDDQLMRYSRQLLLPQFDIDGQEALAGSTVLMVGAGGLGCPAALYLAGAGIGKLVIVDPDEVEQHNLHRQVAFRETDIGKPKAEALADQLRALNPEPNYQSLVERVDEVWLHTRLPKVDAVLDCTDNFESRRAINHACVKANTPLISGAAIRMEGQLAVFDRRQEDAACYACLYGDSEGMDERCAESGILGPVVGAVGTLQALLTIQLLTGKPVAQKLHRFDGETMEWHSATFRRDRGCLVCGEKERGARS
jgi:molybdopterin/thiamine biosynthesis adenylyltransferase